MKQAKFADCKNCPLQDERNTLVPSFGPKSPKLIVVGEGPGKDESWFGRPFQGESGRLLRATLEKYGLDPEQDVYYTNATLCWPKMSHNKEADKDAALKACSGRLHYTLGRLDDSIPVLVLGRWAQDVMGITLQERWEKVWNKWCLATLHPAAILRAGEMGSIFGEMVKFEYAVVKAISGPHNVLGFPDWVWGASDRTWEVDPILPDLNQDFGRITIDIETTSKEWTDPDGEILLVGIRSKKLGKSWIFTKEYLAWPETQAWLRALFAQHWPNIGGHNFKFDLLWLKRFYGVAKRFSWDSIIMVNCLNEYWHKDLKSLATFYGNADDYADRLVYSHLRQYKRVKDKTFDNVPPEQLQEYLALDLVYTEFVADALEAELKAAGRWEWPYLNHEMPQQEMLTEVEWHGVAVDLEQIKTEQALFQRDMDMVREQVGLLSNGEIENPGSHPQVRKHLFGTLKLKPTTYTEKGEASTSEAALEPYKEHPMVEAILMYRRVQKLKTSYLDNILKFVVVDKFGQARVHTHYKAFNVITHRLSAEHPAVQTIPHKDVVKDNMPEWLQAAITKLHPEVEFNFDYGSRIKNCYVAPSGYTLVGADGDAWEISTATVQAKDEVLAGALRQGISPHNIICDMMWPEGWTKAQRVREKNCFFGWLYFGSDYALSMETGIDIRVVSEMTTWMASNLKDIQAWRLQQVVRAKAGSITIPFFNYEVHFPLVNDTVLKDLPKAAANYPNQGLGSLLMMRAAYKARPEIERLGGRLVLLVHDSVIAEVPDHAVDQVSKIMMASIVATGQEFSQYIPWGAECETGKRWGSMDKLEV